MDTSDTSVRKRTRWVCRSISMRSACRRLKKISSIVTDSLASTENWQSVPRVVVFRWRSFDVLEDGRIDHMHM